MALTRAKEQLFVISNKKLTKKELGFFINNGDFIVEPGDFEIFVGGSSNTSLKDKFTLL